MEKKGAGAGHPGRLGIALSVFFLAAAVSVLFGMSISRASGKTADRGEKSSQTFKQLQVGTAAENEAAASDEKPGLSLHALSAVLMDGESGRILYAKEGSAVRPMASTTKIMTCILALENGTLSDVCQVSREAAAQPKVKLGAPEGTEFVLEDLLYSLMLESHNDTAVTIAQHVGGSVEAFTEMMNQKARDLGCQNTYFVTPNGLDGERTLADGTTRIHGTTAAELASIMRYCVFESPMKEEFLRITRAGSHQFSDVSRRQFYSCVNHNAFLQMMDGAISGKTGFTGEAGYCYVAAFSSGEKKLVAAFLGSGWPPHKNYKWEDARKLLEYGNSRYERKNIYQEQEPIWIPLENGVEERRILVGTGLPRQERQLVRLLREEEEKEIRIRVQVPDALCAPVRRGDPAGSIVYSLGEETWKVFPLYAMESAEKWSFSWCLRALAGQYLQMEDGM